MPDDATAPRLITALRHDPALCNFTPSPFISDRHNSAPPPSAYLLLPYHLDRLRSAAAQHGSAWSAAACSLSLAQLESACTRSRAAHDTDAATPLKLRLALSPDGALDASATPVPPLPPPALAHADPFHLATLAPPSLDPAQPAPALELRLDDRPTRSSLYTRTKTTSRAHYDAARARRGVCAENGRDADVLLFDEDRRISEASVRNVAFWRGAPPRWVTPAETTGCLPGVARRWLIENGWVVEDVQGALTVDGLVEGEVALVFNAVEGCRLAVVRRCDGA